MCYNLSCYLPNEWYFDKKNCYPEELDSSHSVIKIRTSDIRMKYKIYQAKEFNVIVNPESEGKLDGFIDDTMFVGIYEKYN